MSTKIEIPSVLSFEKKIVVSDAYMYGTTWDNEHQSAVSPLKLVQKSVRGTISNRLKPAMKKDPAKLNAEIEKANLQTIDACSLDITQDTLNVVFTVKVLSGVSKPSACNDKTYTKMISSEADSYIEKSKCKELAYRYAHNLANARFLWRNRLGAEQIDVIIEAGSDIRLHLNAYDFPTLTFEHNHGIDALADRISEALSGTIPFLLIKVSAFAKVGAGQEVYPSEELVFDKGKSDKSKVLYEVGGVAAMHSQKIGNAIRSIDTWYPAFGTEDGIGPIAVEPYGAVTSLSIAFRNPKDNADFYTLLDKFVSGESITDDEKHYVMAVLIRGGVFGGKTTED